MGYVFEGNPPPPPQHFCATPDWRKALNAAIWECDECKAWFRFNSYEERWIDMSEREKKRWLKKHG